MLLKSLKFSRSNNWSLEGKPIEGEYNQPVTFSDINLIVGKNATGKSKTINILRQLSDLLSGKVDLSNLIFDTSTYDLLFENEGEIIEYFLDFVDGKVKQETLKINNILKLDRAGKQLFYEEVQKFLSIDIEDNKLALSRIDKQQQPFFNSLHNWGKNLNHYRFGGQLGKDTFLRDINSIKEDLDTELKNVNNVAEIFLIAKNKFGNDFISSIKSDLKQLSYNIKDVKTTKLKHFKNSAFGLAVYEEDINDLTDQIEMSQGMFRVLSLIIQLNYSLLLKTPSCILIDDIGEGLDYDRSKELIKLIIDKIKGTNIQILMTTNDRFVMNEIPLKYWSVIHRQPNKSIIYNYDNSKEIFDEFKYTGLSNFDFLSTEYYFE